MADTYALELRLTGRKCVIVGGGSVAARKAETLAKTGAELHVIAPEMDDAIRTIPGIHCHAERYHAAVLAGATLVFACTDDATVNRQAADDARAAGAWVNVADDPSYCDFFVPACMERGDLRITVSTAGASPQLAGMIRRRLESSFGPEYAILVRQLRDVRSVVRRRIHDPQARRAVFERLCTDDSIALVSSKGPAAWREWAEKVIEEAAGQQG